MSGPAYDHEPQWDAAKKLARYSPGFGTGSLLWWSVSRRDRAQSTEFKLDRGWGEATEPALSFGHPISWAATALRLHSL
jgi:hypothetical protein